jgi:hypothetical protein
MEPLADSAEYTSTEGRMARLSARLLGTLQVTLRGTPVTDFESDKERALLAFLAEESQQPHRREKLVGPPVA